MKITVNFKDTQSKINVFLKDNAEKITAVFKDVQPMAVADYYEGDYSFTPSSEEQVVPIAGKTATENIVIDPIPSNYALVTWDGVSLRFS